MNETIGTGTPGQDAFPPVEELTYEQARDELIETVKILELGQMGLDESLKYWERGEALAKACEAHLDGAARRVEKALDSADNSEDATDAENASSNEGEY
ncbi:exodeoxyribonuclease VII small subunit [Corynebacterium sp. HMSC06D04]|uniref:Exodeoxyribonuclease 7 small subunit n=2 Tax=Corynebacterium TaxID=1716 RepID=A0A2A4ALB4_9CORY|nr:MULTISPECIES: exodeoxyribonuclease VII small subunit [Corynebacterium]PCC83194.1 exodeoxyribonuclease VII small subunit [Corynebacterium accolens]KXU18361.1 exodeoxyribonuclease VII, small subunit [Corynebacterium simulans]MCG7247777.1 exodeoxyribonuclease VII small subunit [Corynebacterium simulans]MDK7138705.1 exodeoxyribonuclease VII small subunit [Corynebacterium simulans]OFL97810.1 exodeoxyribonuclease VII small subunit [Corynebacterium sp. HMSC071F07]